MKQKSNIMILPINSRKSLSFIIDENGDLSITTCHIFGKFMEPICQIKDKDESEGTWLEWNEGLDYPDTFTPKTVDELLDYLNEVKEL